MSKIKSRKCTEIWSFGNEIYESGMQLNWSMSPPPTFAPALPFGMSQFEHTYSGHFFRLSNPLSRTTVGYTIKWMLVDKYNSFLVFLSLALSLSMVVDRPHRIDSIQLLTRQSMAFDAHAHAFQTILCEPDTKWKMKLASGGQTTFTRARSPAHSLKLT